VDWSTATLPWVAIASKRRLLGRKEGQGRDGFAFPIAFGSNSDLYQRLVLKEQKVDDLAVGSAAIRTPNSLPFTLA